MLETKAVNLCNAAVRLNLCEWGSSPWKEI